MTKRARRTCLLVLWLLSWRGSIKAQAVPQAPSDCRGTTALPSSGSAVKTEDRAVSWRLLIPNIAHDQKPIWLFPVGIARGKHWKPTLGFIVATAGLVALDPHDTPSFRRTAKFAQFNKVMSGKGTALATAVFPVSFYLLGWARRDSYAEQTALLGVEALADTQILDLGLKNISRRKRPGQISPNGDFAHTWFKCDGRSVGNKCSFPSGHTITAFSLATVFAERYQRHRWVPWVAYGLAGLIGFSRVTRQSHFPSDVFAGAVLGYTVSHYLVLRRSS